MAETGCGVQVQEAAPEGTDKWHGRVDLATNTASLMLGQNRLRDAVQLYASTSARCRSWLTGS